MRNLPPGSAWRVGLAALCAFGLWAFVVNHWLMNLTESLWKRLAFFGLAAALGALVLGPLWSRTRRQPLWPWVALSVLFALGFITFAVACMSLAMGAENLVFAKKGEVSLGVTYMTGTLVKLGQKLAAMFWGGARTAWVPYFTLWAGLICGAVLGAISYSYLGLQSLWIATVFSAVILGWTSVLFKE